MKRTNKAIAILLSMLMLLTVFAPMNVVSFAEGEEDIIEQGDCGADGSDVHYTLYSDGKLIIEGTGEIVDWWSNGKPVKEGIGVIKDCAFQQRTDIREVVISEDITHVGDYAFDGCTALETVRLPQSKTTFGVSVFSNCSSLNDFSIPDYLLHIPDHMFDGCSSLDITIPKRVERIGIRAFANTALQELNISPLYIAEGAFANCDSLKYAILPCLAMINSQVFAGCTSLEWVEVSPGLETAIKSEAFGNPGASGCNALADVYVMASEEKWNSSVTIAENNDCLLNATLHFHEDEKHENLVESIEEPTCTKAGSAVFTCTLCGRQITDEVPALEHDYVWTIEQNSTETEPGFASAVCANDPTHTLSFEIPARCTAEKVGECGANGDAVFYVLYNDNTLVVLGTGEIRECAFSPYYHSVLSRTTDIIIKDGITAIGAGAFQSYSFYGGATSETSPSVVLADSVKTIHHGAFADCAFSSFDFGSVEKIERNAFYLTSIAQVVLPDTLTYLGAQNFQACMMTDTTVVFGDNLKYIDDWTFQHSNLERAVFLNPNTEIHSSVGEAFMSSTNYTSVGRPPFYSYAGGSVETYANQYGHPFVDLTDYHEYDDGVITVYPTETTPGEIVYTCALCGQENPVELPAALTVVERGDCGADGSDVKYVLYSDGTMVISGDGAIKEKAFENREDITSLWVMDGVTEIGKSAFWECHALQSVSLADTVKAVDDFAFLDCNGVSAIDYGNGLESIGEDSFRSTPTKAPIILPNSLKTIGLQAFEYTEFNTVVFGTGLEYAADGALYCTCVNRVAFLNGNTVIGENNQGGLTWMNEGYRPTFYSYAGGSVEENAAYRGHDFVDLATVTETDHDWSAGVVTTLPTCTETGVKTYVCLNNPTHTYTEVIPKIPHKWVIDSTEPTCVDAGSRVYTCALCDATHVETLPATGEHTYDDGIITVYPTETTDGEIRYTCTECGYSYTATVPATPYQDWLYTESEPIEHKQIGEHVYYTLYADGHASIYGTGNSYTDAEWNDEQNRSIFGLEQRNNVTSIEIHQGVTGLLMDFACSSCHNVQSLKLPKSFINMTWETFYHCSGLQTIEVDPANPAWSAVDNVLFNKAQTELVLCAISKPGEIYTIPATVETIGTNAFFCNKNLKEITIPGSVRTIGETAFMGCEALETVHFNDGLETMERGAFYRCYALKSVELPESVTVLEEAVFGDDESLTSITLPNGLTTIGDYVFGACVNMESITIPGSVTSIGSSAFWNWTSLQHVYFTCTQAEWDAIEIGEWNEPLQDANTQIHFGGHSYDDGVITTPVNCDGNSVKTFTCVYCGNTYIETTPTSLPAGDHDWGDWTIAQNSTYDEPGLAQRVCKTNPDHTETFVIPAYGPAVKVGYCGKDGDPVYFAIYEDNTMHVFGEGVVCENVFLLVRPYQPSDLVIDEGITELARLSFRYMGYDEGYLTSVTFPDSLTKIGQASFWDCTNITEIRFGKGLTYVDMDAFPYLTHLETVALPDSVTHLGNQAFYGCVRLKTAVIPAGVPEIGSKTFCECRRLENLVILNGNATMADNCLVEIDGATPTIYSYEGGSVEAFANEHGFNFVPLDDAYWVRLPYTTDGLADGDWYFDAKTFVDIIGDGKTDAEKQEVLNNLLAHVAFYYYPDGELFLLRYDYNELPIDGVPATGFAMYPFELIAHPKTASRSDYNAMLSSIFQYEKPADPDPQTKPDTPTKPEEKPKEKGNWFQEHIIAPMKAAVSTILSFFRKLFKSKK